MAPKSIHRTRLAIAAVSALLCMRSLPRTIAADAPASPTPAAFDPKAPYLDPKLPVEKRVEDLLSRLSVEEKAMLLDHRGPDLARLNIKSDKWNQCLHGVWWDRPTTMFPVSIALAATWDVSLVHEETTAISDEARGIYNGWHLDPNQKGEHKGLIYRAPVINVSRNPYWGRINECFGEDPFLTGRIGVAYVKGLQGDDPKYLKLAATLKHFAVNNVEQDRKKLNAVVPERMLYEFWLPHFRDCIVEGKACSIMASYNAINGTPNNINHLLLTDILKNQWGFDGFVVSDLGGVNTMVSGHEKGKMSFEDAVAQSLNAGCDFSDKEFRTYIPAAVKQGSLGMARLDDAVGRVMRDRIRLGEFDPADLVPYSKIPFSVVGSEEHRQLALKVAQKSIVLLKNSDHLLPLDRTKIKTIAVIGPHANVFTAGGYSGKPMAPVTPLQGIKNRAPGITVLSAVGATFGAPSPGEGILRNPNGPQIDRPGEIQKAVDAAKQADVAILYVGSDLSIEGEGHDRPTLNMPGNQEDLIQAVLAANPRTVVVEMNAGPITAPWVKENVPAIVEAWWAGEQGGNAIADVLFGDVNPGGKMPLTVYASADQVPPQNEYDVTKGFTYLYLKGEPLFAFGRGLSYTDFKYSNLLLDSPEVDSAGNVGVHLDVENTGKVAGDEVVQLYVHEQKASVVRPAKELRGFERITLAPGEKKSVVLSVPASKLAFYDDKSHAFVVNPGMYDVMVGSASDDIRETAQVTVVATTAK